MDKEFVKLIAEGLVKAKNKARKKEFETYGHDSSPKAAPVGQRALKSMSKTKHDKSGASKRAIFRGNRAIESILVEGLIKKMNKAKKNALQGGTPESKVKARTKAKTDFTRTKAGEEHAGLNAAGVMRRAGKKATAKLFLKGSKRTRQGKDFTALESMIVSGFEKLLEAKDPLETDKDSISAAGGDSDTYAAIKAKKDAKIATAARNTGSRADTLGKMGGMYDKKGQPWKEKKPASASKFAKSAVKKPLPLNLKGKPGSGKKMGDVRGKAVNTSRSTGKEDGKINAIQSGFDKLVSGLAKGKK